MCPTLHSQTFKTRSSSQDEPPVSSWPPPTPTRPTVLATPTSRADPNPLIAPWGVRFTGGLVIDPARSENLDFANVIVERFPSASPVDVGVSRLQLSAGGGLFVAVPAGRPGLTVARLAVASGRSFDYRVLVGDDLTQ